MDYSAKAITFAVSHYCALPQKRALIHEKIADIHLVANRTLKYGEFPYFMRHILEENNVKDEMPDCTVEEFYHYYPFGELMAESSYGSFKAQRYTGKESDTWLGPSVIDNSARFKLGAAGTFTSVDRLADQTPGVSPYLFCGGDPINHTDPTGNDYEEEIDPAKREWRIKAQFYTFERFVANLQKGLDFWNNLSGVFEINGYTVVFDLTYIVVDENDKHTRNGDIVNELRWYVEADRRKSKFELNSTDYHYSSSNAYFEYKNANNMKSGTTFNGSIIGVNKLGATELTIAHEIGHVLGLGHFWKGIMTRTSSDPNRSPSISYEEISHIISSGLRGNPFGGDPSNPPGRGFFRYNIYTKSIYEIIMKSTIDSYFPSNY